MSMKLDQYDSIYFLGIGGIGMSGIAEVLFNQKQTNYGIDFYLKIVIPKKNEKIEYSGYKEGTRSEFVLSETVF